MMIFLDGDAIAYLKKRYIKTCIALFIGFACICGIAAKVSEQEEEIEYLTKKVKELDLKGD